MRYAPMVRRIATRLARRLPAHVGLQDLIGYGWMGLTEAFARAPIAMRENEVDAFVSYRVKGAMLDYLRSLDPAAREARNAGRRLTRAQNNLTRSLGRAPEQAEVAAAMGLDEGEYRRLVATVAGVAPPTTETIDLEGLDLESPVRAPDEEAGRRMLCASVADAIAGLPERLREVVRLSYIEECTLREIGQILGVSESRVCQLHAEAMKLLRSTLASV